MGNEDNNTFRKRLEDKTLTIEDEEYLQKQCILVAERFGYAKQYTFDEYRGKVEKFDPDIIYNVLAIESLRDDLLKRK